MGNEESRNLKDEESPLRRMMADAAGTPYVSYKTLQEAQADPQGVAILEGDDGGQIYVVVPAAQVRASEPALEQLLRDLDSIAWPGQPDMAGIFYERREVGSQIGGGMGGGVATSKAWINDEFIRLGLESEIRRIIEGDQDRLSQLQPVDLARAYWRGGLARDAGRIVYEALDPTARPPWAASLLEFAIAKAATPSELVTAISVAKSPSRWPEGHSLFQRIRQHTLRAEASSSHDALQLALLLLAENTAKVAYNASGRPAPFDHIVGWRIVANLFDVAAVVHDQQFSDRALDLVVAPLEGLS